MYIDWYGYPSYFELSHELARQSAEFLLCILGVKWVNGRCPYCGWHLERNTIHAAKCEWQMAARICGVLP